MNLCNGGVYELAVIKQYASLYGLPYFVNPENNYVPSKNHVVVFPRSYNVTSQVFIRIDGTTIECTGY
jgi:hypothetical protein